MNKDKKASRPAHNGKLDEKEDLGTSCSPARIILSKKGANNKELEELIR